MKNTIYILLAVFMLAAAPACKKETEYRLTKITGTIQKQGITTYQYGTHVLTDNNGQTTYALKSGKDAINLDDYINKFVEVRGHLMRDYPVDGGPQYLVVTKVVLQN
jgi:hypothetical protein